MINNYPTEQDAVKIIEDVKGEKFTEYRRKWNEVNNFNLETDFPLFLHIELLYKCNFKCPMCTHGDPNLIKKYGYHERFKNDDVKKILEEGSKYGCPSVSFQGDNEPFLIKQITDYFKLAHELGYLDIMVNTNGSLVNEKVSRNILNSNLTRLRFSLDAYTENTYKKIRVGGDYKKVHQNIDNFLKMKKDLNKKLPIVGVNLVKMRENSHEINDFVNYWKKKVDYIVIQDFETPDINEKYEEMGYNLSKVNNDIFKCEQPWQRLYVRGNQEINPCCAFFNKYLNLGKLDKMSLHQAWNSTKMKELRKLHKEGKFYKNQICLKCSRRNW